MKRNKKNPAPNIGAGKEFNTKKLEKNSTSSTTKRKIKILRSQVAGQLVILSNAAGANHPDRPSALATLQALGFADERTARLFLKGGVR